VLAVASALVVLASGPALAHAALIETDPADGSTHATAPSTATLTFNETVGNAAVVVSAPDGSSVEVSDVRSVDRRVTATVADVDQRGTYTLSYRVVSADGHPVEGTIHYDVTTGREVTQQQPIPQADDESFIHRHRSHIIWAILAVGLGIILLLEPLRRRDDSDNT